MMQKKYKKVISSAAAAFFACVFFLPMAANAAIVQCGTKAVPRMCTLCDMISGLNIIIRYIMWISVGVGVAAITAAGVMYIVSAGDGKLIDRAKSTMKNALIGFVVIFSAWVIVNTTITVIGARPGFGMNITSWGKFDCNASVR